MSVTQTYYLAHTARRKLSKEASRADHDLRLLVSHANLLDSLMVKLSNAEREQERWFNHTVSSANNASHNKTHIQWADSIAEEPEEDWDAEAVSDDSDTESDLSDDENFDEDSSIYTASMTPLRRTTPPITIITQQELSDLDEAEDDDEAQEALALTRSSPHSPPPELLEDLEDDSDEDVSPPSPPQPTLNIFNHAHPKTTPGMDITDTDITSFSDEYISPHGSSTMISAY